ncbi:MAG TPA: helix-turn-helix transcriptional regulator, partial [Kribbella sp.]|nr:helix-turn-helix transcriptional regulator [Kribbella sp.]
TTYREMADETHFSHAHLVRAAGGEQLPSWEVARAYLMACGVTSEGALGAWEKYWAATDAVAARPSRRGRPPKRRRPGPERIATMPEFGLYLQSLSRRNGQRTLRELQELTGVGRSTINDWFQGRRLPSLALLRRFAVLMGADRAELDKLQVVRHRLSQVDAHGAELRRALAAVQETVQDDETTQAMHEVSVALAKAEGHRANRSMVLMGHETGHYELGDALPRRGRTNGSAKYGMTGRKASRVAYELERFNAAQVAKGLEDREASRNAHQNADDTEGTDAAASAQDFDPWEEATRQRLRASYERVALDRIAELMDRTSEMHKVWFTKLSPQNPDLVLVEDGKTSILEVKSHRGHGAITEGGSMPTEIEEHAGDLLEAMYEAERADTDQDDAILAYLDQAGHETAYGYTLVDILADNGLVNAHHTLGRPRGMITPEGIRAVQQLHADRANPKIRATALRKAMLVWLDDQEEQGAEPASFQEFADSLDPTSKPQFSERELRGTAGFLHRKELIEAVHVEESTDGWIRPRLTVDGRECITDHDGDVAAYLRDRQSGGTTDNSTNTTTVHISDNNGNLSINGDRFTQNYAAGVDVAELLEFAGGLRQMLPVLGLDTATQQELAEAADQLHTEASSPKPDHGRLRQLLKRLLDGLNQAAPTVAKTMLLAAGEAAQKAITGG